MDAEYANYYTREVMLILIREFQSPDEEMKKIVLKVRISEWCLCKRTAAHSRLFNQRVVASGLVVRYIKTNMRISRKLSHFLSVLTLHPLVTFTSWCKC